MYSYISSAGTEEEERIWVNTKSKHNIVMLIFCILSSERRRRECAGDRNGGKDKVLS